MKWFAKALPFLAIAAVVVDVSCDSDSDTTDTNFTVSTGDPPPEACNGGDPDGFCNALGAVPETCTCFDCVETAYCLGSCNDNGACEAGEDQTCEDCYGVQDGPTTATTTNATTTNDATTTATTSGMGGMPGNGGFGGMPAGNGGFGGMPSTTSATTGGAGGVGGTP